LHTWKYPQPLLQPTHFMKDTTNDTELPLPLSTLSTLASFSSTKDKEGSSPPDSWSDRGVPGVRGWSMAPHLTNSQCCCLSPPSRFPTCAGTVRTPAKKGSCVELGPAHKVSQSLHQVHPQRPWLSQWTTSPQRWQSQMATATTSPEGDTERKWDRGGNRDLSFAIMTRSMTQ
jgi:hypothetical protein